MNIHAAGEAPEKSVDVQISIFLKEQNRAFKVEKYEHSYPHCWRTDKPVLYYPLDSWFIKVTDVKERMTALNNTIQWKPESTGTGRFGNWLENANDWNLSRSRYWGIPIPIWSTEDRGEQICINSVAQLKAECDKSVAAGVMSENPLAGFVPNDFSEENYAQLDLHKNYVDLIVLVSPSGKPMKRESDLIDVWFDSGAMPYAQWHYPFENKSLVDSGQHFRPISLPKVLTKPVDGSIPCTPLRPWCLTALPTKMWFPTAWCSTKTVLKCQNDWAMPLIRLKHWPNTVRMQHAGT